ncbi:hypothetical protein [Virgibacillus sp.]
MSYLKLSLVCRRWSNIFKLDTTQEGF